MEPQRSSCSIVDNGVTQASGSSRGDEHGGEVYHAAKKSQWAIVKALAKWFNKESCPVVLGLDQDGVAVMEDRTSVANRDEPVSLLTVPTAASKDAAASPGPKSGIRRAVSPSRLQEKLQDKLGATSILKSQGLQDRVFSALFQQIFPQHVPDTGKPDRRSAEYVQRPGFSLPLMSTNFRRFNARIGAVFVFQNRLIRLFSWRVPTQTLSFLAVYSFCCLDPSLLAVVPLAACLLAIMIPAFAARHPPPPNTPLTETYDIHGPASSPPPNIKPAPEMSKDFFRNMRDLQNSMEDFSVAHDQLIHVVAPLTNFSDERLSTTIFLGLSVGSCVLFIASAIIPWRLLLLAVGWIAVCSVHPVAVQIISTIDRGPIIKQLKRTQSAFYRWVNEDIVLDRTPERKDVEIFELQRKHDGEWEAWVYAVSPYTPRSPLRVSGDRPRGTRYFEDVEPPLGWEWSGKKWTVDLLSRDWVDERMVTAVEVEMEGERWVYDSTTDERQDASSKKETANGSSREELSGFESQGDWRRRRWIRQVQRRIVKSETTSKGGD